MPLCLSSFLMKLLFLFCTDCVHSRSEIHAIDSNTSKPLPRQEARGVDASFKGLRAHSMQKGEETGISYVSRGETVILSMLEPYSRPLIAVSQRSSSVGCAPSSQSSPNCSGGVGVRSLSRHLCQLSSGPMVWRTLVPWRFRGIIVRSSPDPSDAGGFSASS